VREVELPHGRAGEHTFHDCRQMFVAQIHRNQRNNLLPNTMISFPH
jgi:hypothetical protein